MIPSSTILSRICEQYKGTHKVDQAPHQQETCVIHQVPGFKGRVGFISSMTDNFCASCTRLRLTADGSLEVCLFGAREVNLRDILRSGSESGINERVRKQKLLGVIGAAVKRKAERHAGLEVLPRLQNRPMSLIGG